jgi:hypothetical protein
MTPTETMPLYAKLEETWAPHAAEPGFLGTYQPPAPYLVATDAVPINGRTGRGKLASPFWALGERGCQKATLATRYRWVLPRRRADVSLKRARRVILIAGGRLPPRTLQAIKRKFTQ